MTKIRTLIVDDEPMARERVLTLLKQQPDIEVVGECADGAQALSAIERLEPELVFLDVQIPVMDGFGVLRALAPTACPWWSSRPRTTSTRCAPSRCTRWTTC